MNIPQIEIFFETGKLLADHIRKNLKQGHTLYLLIYQDEKKILKKIILENNLETIAQYIANNINENINILLDTSQLTSLILKKLKYTFLKQHRSWHTSWVKLNPKINNILFKISSKKNTGWPGEKLEIKICEKYPPVTTSFYICQTVLSIHEITDILNSQWYLIKNPHL